MYMSTRIAIFGAGKIGSATHQLIHEAPVGSPLSMCKAHIFDADVRANELRGGQQLDVAALTSAELVQVLRQLDIKYVINALPYFLNVKLATVALEAGCHYLDFTEDDAAADAVHALYATQDALKCATKCGLAPGFINYVGAELVAQLERLDEAMWVTSLKIRVGALPVNVAFTESTGLADSYALSWSVDGLVNEYIRPCRVREHGMTGERAPLSGAETVIINGSTYEARYTSGGVGTLLTDFPNIPNVDYKTLRYPGHYRHVEQARMEAGWLNAPVERVFTQLRDKFRDTFAWTNNDIIVVFAQATGVDSRGDRHVRNFAARYGQVLRHGQVYPLTGIQTTTAGGLLSVLELLLEGRLDKTIITHRDVPFTDFTNTSVYASTYGAIKCS